MTDALLTGPTPAPAAAGAAERAPPFGRVSLARQFLGVSAVVVLLVVLASGIWVADRIERSVVDRTARMASVYFESIVAGRLDRFIAGGMVDDETRRVLDGLFVDGPLAQKVVRFKLWSPDGRIHYSSDHVQDGMVFPLHDHHALALSGRIVATMSELDGPDNAPERAQWRRLLEIYLPLRAPGAAEVSAVAEFYHSTDNIDADIRRAQRDGWLVIVAGALALYAVLYALVHRASCTIRSQQGDLQRQLEHLQRVLADNRQMHQRLQRAGAQTTSLAELSLRRIAADLHDGPAQDLALALLRLDDATAAPAATVEGARLRDSLQRALASLREIASGLVVPGMGALSLAEVVQRAAHDAGRGAGVSIAAEIDPRLGEAPEALKIAAYRVVQEALSNSLRHAAGHPPRLVAEQRAGELWIEVADDGPGFDPRQPPAEGHLGLAFLRERVQLLSGTIEIDTAPGRGTRLRVRLPLAQPAPQHG